MTNPILILVAVRSSDWPQVRSTVSRLGLPASEAEHLVGWVIRADRRGELGPRPERPWPSKPSPLAAWRIDASLMSLGLGPALLWRLRLPDGRMLTLQLSLKHFHQLRYQLASMLRELFMIQNSALCSK